MKFTLHARDQMRRRGISARHLEAALSTGREAWRKGALLIMHGSLRVIVCPFTGRVITAWWQGKGKTRTGSGRIRKKNPAEAGSKET